MLSTVMTRSVRLFQFPKCCRVSQSVEMQLEKLEHPWSSSGYSVSCILALSIDLLIPLVVNLDCFGLTCQCSLCPFIISLCSVCILLCRFDSVLGKIRYTNLHNKSQRLVNFFYLQEHFSWFKLFIERMKKGSCDNLMYILQNIKVVKVGFQKNQNFSFINYTSWNLLFIAKLVTNMWIKVSDIQSNKMPDWLLLTKGKAPILHRKQHKTIVYWIIWFINLRINSSQK